MEERWVWMLMGGPIDKIVTLAARMRYDYEIAMSTDGLARLRLCFRDTHPEKVGEVSDEVDVFKRYHDEKGTFVASSAFEMAARDMDILGEPGVGKALKEIAENNKTGWLKELPLPFADLLRRMYLFPHDKSKKVEHREWVIRSLLPICDDYLRMCAEGIPKNDKAQWRVFSRKFGGMIGRDNFHSHPLTLCGHAYRRFLRGDSYKEIRDFIDRWLSLFRESEQYDLSKLSFVEIQAKLGDRLEFWQIGGGTVVFICDWDDGYVARAAFRQRDIAAVLVRNTAGNYVLQFSRKNCPYSRSQVQSLFKDLDEGEPGLWYQDDRYARGKILPLIANGTFAVYRESSGLNPDRVEEKLLHHLGDEGHEGVNSLLDAVADSLDGTTS